MFSFTVYIIEYRDRRVLFCDWRPFAAAANQCNLQALVGRLCTLRLYVMSRRHAKVWETEGKVGLSQNRSLFSSSLTFFTPLEDIYAGSWVNQWNLHQRRAPQS